MQRYTVYLYLETALHVLGGLHPSSGAHTTVSTTSGTCQTVMDRITYIANKVYMMV